jgi:hypothetical protein
MKNFYLSDAAFISTLRYLSWLGPCPEFSCLLLDWSRWNNPTKAGGLPAVLLPIFELVSKGNLVAAKKLAFAQQLISGVPDAGSWGGEALSDIEIRVKARNIECCRVLQCFLDEHEENSKDLSLDLDGSSDKEQKSQISESQLLKVGPPTILKVAILYGAYHIGDLSTKLKAMGLQAGSVSSLTAWSMESPSPEGVPLPSSIPSTYPFSSSSSVSNSKPFPLPSKADEAVVKDQFSIDENNSVNPTWFSLESLLKLLKRVRSPLLTLAVALTVTSYLVIGALDWWLLIDFLVEVLESVTNIAPTNKTSVIRGLLSQILEGSRSLSLTENDKILVLSFTVIYSVLYVQRHLFAQRTANTLAVQWDRGLFDDTLERG